MVQILKNLWGFALIVAIAVAPRAAGAQDTLPMGITVQGIGVAQARPDIMQFHVKLGATGELGSDALAKYQEYRKRAAESMRELKLEGLEPGSLRMEVGKLALTTGADASPFYQGFFPGQVQVTPLKPEVAVGGMIRITLHGISRIPEEKAFELSSMLLDKLRDSGLGVLPSQQAFNYDPTANDDPYAWPALAAFVLTDAGAVRARARSNAFQAARADAEEIAQLAGMKLGGVISIHDQSNDSIPTFVDESYVEGMDEVDLTADPTSAQPGGATGDAGAASSEAASSDAAGPDAAASVAVAEQAAAREAPSATVTDGQGQGAPKRRKLRMVSRTAGPIPVTVNLQVRFAVVP